MPDYIGSLEGLNKIFPESKEARAASMERDIADDVTKPLTGIPIKKGGTLQSLVPSAAEQERLTHTTLKKTDRPSVKIAPADPATLGIPKSDGISFDFTGQGKGSSNADQAKFFRDQQDSINARFAGGEEALDAALRTQHNRSVNEFFDRLLAGQIGGGKKGQNMRQGGLDWGNMLNNALVENRKYGLDAAMTQAQVGELGAKAKYYQDVIPAKEDAIKEKADEAKQKTEQTNEKMEQAKASREQHIRERAQISADESVKNDPMANWDDAYDRAFKKMLQAGVEDIGKTVQETKGKRPLPVF